MRLILSTCSALPMMAPATMSEWPFMYFVQLWRERSKPCSSGRKLTGVANVLSIIDTSPCDRAKRAIASRSATCMSGFVIVST